ncbi:hypothetical protein V6Z11_A10G199400 [Gossypium hirsutum]
MRTVVEKVDLGGTCSISDCAFHSMIMERNGSSYPFSHFSSLFHLFFPFPWQVWLVMYGPHSLNVLVLLISSWKQFRESNNYFRMKATFKVFVMVNAQIRC